MKKLVASNIVGMMIDEPLNIGVCLAAIPKRKV